MNSICLMEFQDNAGVYNLISRLCNKIASKCNDRNLTSQKKLATKMRSRSFELLLKKAQTEFPSTKSSAMTDLFSYYFILQQNIKNIVDYKRCLELKNIINMLRESKYEDNYETVQVLKFLISLKDMVRIDSSEIFKTPFAFGILDLTLPRLQREEYGSIEPYQYYPAYIFELPFTLKNQVSVLDSSKSQTFQEYAVEVFESRSYLPALNYSYAPKKNEKRSLMTPSIESWSDASELPYFGGNFLDFPRLTAPRNLRLPVPETNSYNLKVSMPDTCFEGKTIGDSKTRSIDIWEIASQIDKNLPDDIWEIVAKMPPVDERQLIATNTREVGLWRLVHNQVMIDLCVISEKIFISHLMYLIIGVDTSSFPYCNESHCFYMKENLCLEGISKEHIVGYVSGLLLTGTYFKRLYNFAFNQALDDHFHENGLIYEAAREVVRQFLIKFRLHATEIFEESHKHISDDVNCMPTLLEILYHIEPLQYEMETVATIFKMTNADPKTTIPRGMELMSYLFNEISLITNSAASNTLFNSLFSVCKVYFKFIEKFIFEGELEDRYHEFFIRKDSQYVNSRSKKYWDKGFHISQSVSVPEFLKVLAKCILLCGKSLRLLKLCNPSDPLVVLISTNHPTVKCCCNLEELENQQQILDVYRTRCLFVSGEPVTFRQILLKRDAEKKAFTEMASQKQAETMEKIMAERKRLTQLIIAEKQHSLRVLEAAIAETKAAKIKSKRRERLKTELEQESEKAREELDSKLRDDERNKMLDYYSKLNMEVEKSKIHTEWKIKRLQLDEVRMQLLSSEERNLKREKLELEHQQNEMNTSVSLTSEISFGCEDAKSDTILQKSAVNVVTELHEQSELTGNSSDTLNENLTNNETDITTIKITTKEGTKKRNSSEMFNFIYNAAKNMFGFKCDETIDTTKCDNVNQIDAQGNVVLEATEINSNTFHAKDVDQILKGDEEDKRITFSQFSSTRHEADMNKKRGTSHGAILIDIENNQRNISVVDTENNLTANNRILNEFNEAERNKMKVLGTELGNVNPEPKKAAYEPRTEAQKEAVLNKQKVLGVEYNLPAEISNLKVPANKAQEEALVNKQKAWGVEYNLPAEISNFKVPANKAQEEALVNKQKALGVEYNLPAEICNFKVPANKAQEEALVNKENVLGVKYNLPAESSNFKLPANKAQEEALVNKQKALGVEYNLPAEIRNLKVPANEAQEEALVNKQKALGVEYNLPAEISNLKMPVNKSQEEALLNKQKALGVECNVPAEINNLKVPANRAQEEALQNKQKVMGVEYNIPGEVILKKTPLTEAKEKAILNKQKIMGVEYSQGIDIIKQQPINDAQEEALRNRKKILHSDLNFVNSQIVKQMPAKRAGLTLDLKSVTESNINRGQFSITPNTGAVTPAEFFPRLDLETPTTAEAPFDEQITSELFSPNDNENKDHDSTLSKSDKDYLSPKGFNFSTLLPDEEEVESGDNLDIQINTSTENSPTKSLLNDPEMKDSLSMRALWNTKDEYNFENFDPFGIKDLERYSDDYFNKKMDSSSSCYTHPADLMKDLQKSPHTNMFATYFTSKDGDDPKVTCDNIAILTACLQRSVMLPLTYQLEVVNNSILTYFLVDLDMYEHLKSLKDYFFLMDGEFSSTICHNLFMKLNKTVNPQELLNFATLHRILNKSLGSSITRVNKFSENLSFTISEPPLSFHHSSPDVLHCLSLTYEVGWPLNIILSQEALMRYSKVFQFLVKMRRISWVLGQDFEELKFAIKRSKYPRKLQRSPQYISVQLYRHIMASLIRALDNYIVTTCILTSWTEFEDDLKKARTLDDLYECHVIYIKKVLFRCLLNNRSTPVMKLLNDIFTVILKFSRVLRATPWQYKEDGGVFTHANFAQLEEIFHLFEKLAKYLHKVVTRLVECGYQRHLTELLSMVNLNSYYEPDKSKEHNSSLQLT